VTWQLRCSRLRHSGGQRQIEARGASDLPRASALAAGETSASIRLSLEITTETKTWSLQLGLADLRTTQLPGQSPSS